MSSVDLYHYWWAFFHRLSLIIENRSNYDHLVHLGLNLLDCDHCRTDALKFYQNLDIKLTPFEKMHKLHNHVNEVTQKTKNTLEQSYALYQDVIGLDDKITWSIFFKKYFDFLFELTHHLIPAQIPTFREFTSYLIETIPITNSKSLNPILGNKESSGNSSQEFKRIELFKETYQHYVNLIKKTPQIKIVPLTFDLIYSNTSSSTTNNTSRTVTNHRKGGCSKCAERRRRKELYYQQKMKRIKESKKKPKNISPFLGQKDLSNQPLPKIITSPPKTPTKSQQKYPRVIRQVPGQIPIPNELSSMVRTPLISREIESKKGEINKKERVKKGVKKEEIKNQDNGKLQRIRNNKKLIYRSKTKPKSPSSKLNYSKIPTNMINNNQIKSKTPRVIRVNHRNENIPKINKHIRMVHS